jgi:hypothetical protein
MPSLNLPDAPSPADDLLQRACCTALARLGAVVRFRPDAENSVRALCDAAPFGPRAPAPLAGLPAAFDRHAEPVVVIDVAGLPNLLHELVHVALAARLGDDHGFDYRAIPYDLAQASGRAVLWDELSATVVSCAYLLSGAGPTDWVRVDAWFDEQLGIQPVFYGMEDDPSRFWATVPRLERHHRDEASAMMSCAYDRVAALLAAGADHHVAPIRLDFATLWERRGAR